MFLKFTGPIIHYYQDVCVPIQGTCDRNAVPVRLSSLSMAN